MSLSLSQVCADEISLPNEQQEIFKSFYVNMEGTLIDKNVGPGVGLGYRRAIEEGVAIDISASAALVENDYFVSFPSVQILKYSNEISSMNPFIGAGLGFGSYRNDDLRFNGILANVTGGIEFFRKKQLMGTLQAKVSEPILPVKSSGAYFAKPIVSLGFGLGF
jgi:hypothetical protein